MTWAQRTKLFAKAAIVPVLLLALYLAVLQATDIHTSPATPRRSPIASITPTDPMAR